MSEEQRHIPVYVDFTPTHAAHPEMKETTAAIHRQWLERNLDAIMDRQSRLPIMMIHHDSPAAKHVVDLLREARQLFCLGYHYSCVAMCGIVVERIIKDILRHNVFVARGGSVDCPSNKAFDQLERVDVRSLINFVAESGMITTEVKSAAANVGGRVALSRTVFWGARHSATPPSEKPSRSDRNAGLPMTERFNRTPTS